MLFSRPYIDNNGKAQKFLPLLAARGMFSVRRKNKLNKLWYLNTFYVTFDNIVQLQKLNTRRQCCHLANCTKDQATPYEVHWLNIVVALSRLTGHVRLEI